MARAAAPDFHLDASFPRLKGLIIERTGHFYYQDKDDLLWERVRRRIHATNARDCAGYLDRLSNAASGDEEWSRLESEITIGETFFFRYAEQFAALRRTILPDLIARNREERRIRIWSAGCATGAEPYSLAILISELLGVEREGWRINIVGTDINEAFLATARQGRFGKWALRSMPPEERARYFADEGENRWLLRPEYRALVRFERHNLMSLLDGTSPLQFTDFDLVLCRNVLIYFHPDTVLRIVGALRDCLMAEGWLLLGHAEPNPAFAGLLQTVNLPGTAAYRRLPEGVEIPVRQDPAVDVPAIWIPVLPASEPPGSPPLAHKGSPKPRPPAAPRAQSLARSAPDTILAEVRAKANAGLVGEARALCKHALEVQPVNAELHFYDGLLAQAMDLHLDAEKSFRRCLYLDKNFVMAHYHLGLLLLANGRQGPGRRSLANAARLASDLPDTQVLPEGDGVSAGDVRSLVRLHLDTLSRPGQGR
jgi:chemotaxis protein methyltransferase CheR